METTVGDYVGTTIGIHSPHSLLSTKHQGGRASSGRQDPFQRSLGPRTILLCGKKGLGF